MALKTTCAQECKTNYNHYTDRYNESADVSSSVCRLPLDFSAATVVTLFRLAYRTHPHIRGKLAHLFMPAELRSQCWIRTQAARVVSKGIKEECLQIEEIVDRIDEWTLSDADADGATTATSVTMIIITQTLASVQGCLNRSIYYYHYYLQ